MSRPDDERTAAGLAAGLSGQISAASLAMVSVLGAVLLFVLDKRQPTVLGMACVVLSFVCFVVSIAAGAKAVASIYRRGHSGEWSYLTGDASFQVQSLFAILGLLLFPLGIAWMGRSTDVGIDRLRIEIDSASVMMKRLEMEDKALRGTVDCLKSVIGGQARPTTKC